jgi:hypothetical protein
MKWFIAGIMQGSLPSNDVHSQDYRERIKALLKRYAVGTDILCPWELFPDSVTYAAEKAKETLFAMMDEAARCDVLVAYLPEASMGTALEMWRAYQAGKMILSISPLTYNWVIQALSNRVFASLDDFEAFLASGALST